MEQTKPTFSDITDLINQLPDYPAFKSDQIDTLSWLSEWLATYSKTLDLSKGFLVNRCALYWAGYDAKDGFDGQAFVDSCQDSQGPLRQLAQILDTDLQIFELDPHNHAKVDIDAIAMAASYGMMAIEESTQLFCAASFGQGVDSTAKTALNSINEFTTLESFMNDHCGLDHAAMLGACIAGILKGVPIIMEGYSGGLVKSLIEKATNKSFDNIILTNALNLPVNHDLPGHKMIMTAIMLKTIYAGQVKTDCGKIKAAA